MNQKEERLSEGEGMIRKWVCSRRYEKGKLTCSSRARGVIGPSHSERPPHLMHDREKATKSFSLGEGVGGAGVGSLGLLLGVALVKLHELGEIELGLLEDLDLLDEDVLKREDLGALLCDLLGDGVGEAKSKY